MSAEVVADREERLLRAARAGDESAFAELTEPYRRPLHAHCYRMLGSVHDAEDAVQETLLRAWRALPRFAGRSSLRSWLYRIATNVALDAIARRPKRVVPTDYGPAADPHAGPGQALTEPLWVEPLPEDVLAGDEAAGPAARYELRESVELAFVAALQHLPARQRAVLIARDVLGFSARETAEILESSVAGANGALRRARQAVQERLPARSQQQALRTIGDAELRGLVGAFQRAWEDGDVDGILALLTEETTMRMPPMPTWFRGAEAIAAFLEGFAFSRSGRGVRMLPTSASAQPALGSYIRDDGVGGHSAVMLVVLSLDDARIGAIDCFVDPRYVAAVGLPRHLG